MDKILCVEDSSESFKLIETAIGDDYALVWAKSVAEASEFIEAQSFDLVLLDSTLPDGDGLQLCSMIHAHDQWKKMPVVLVTARSNVMDKVMAFALGADDFITKPFEPLELKARLDSLLRKNKRQEQQADLIRCGLFEINKHSQKVTMVTDDGSPRELELTPIEFRLMVMFASAPDVVHPRQTILDTVWGPNVFLASRSVDTSVAKLRAKLRNESERIESVFGVGYRFRG